MRKKELQALIEFSEQLTNDECWEIYRALKRDERIAREWFLEHSGPIFFVCYITLIGTLIGIAKQLGHLA